VTEIRYREPKFGTNAPPFGSDKAILATAKGKSLPREGKRPIEKHLCAPFEAKCDLFECFFARRQSVCATPRANSAPSQRESVLQEQILLLRWDEGADSQQSLPASDTLRGLRKCVPPGIEPSSACRPNRCSRPGNWSEPSRHELYPAATSITSGCGMADSPSRSPITLAGARLCGAAGWLPSRSR
jgi:hypothetical protein